jgi:hypothetical protein
MKKVFSIMGTLAAILIVSRHFGNDFAAQHYSKLAIIFVIGISGQTIFHLWEKKSLNPKGE